VRRLRIPADMVKVVIVFVAVNIALYLAILPFFPECLLDQPYAFRGGFAVDMVLNFSVGVCVLLPTRRPGFMALGGLLTVLVDLDHSLSLLGFVAPARPAHSLLFLTLLVVALLRTVRTLAYVFTACAAFFAQLTMDITNFPLLYPLIPARIEFPNPAMSLVWFTLALAFGILTAFKLRGKQASTCKST